MDGKESRVELELNYLGSSKGFYFIESRRNKKILKSKKLSADELIEVLPIDTWQHWFPRKNKAGEVIGIDWKAAKSKIIEEIGAKEYNEDGQDSENMVSLYKDLVDYINHEPWVIKESVGSKAFRQKYLIREPELGKKLPLLLADEKLGICKKCELESVMDLIVNETADWMYKINEGYGYFDCERSTKAAKYWMSRTDPIPEPAPLLMKGEPGYCYNRADFNYIPGVKESDHPIIGQVFRSKQNIDAVKAFIGSIFIPDSDISQCLLMYDPDGQRGKSKIMKAIGRCVGDAIASSSSPTGEDPFFTSQFEGKRIGIIPDAKNLDFMQDQDFKMMTGGDLVPINNKFGKKYNAKLSCKFIISSNVMPSINGKLCDTRRIIFYEPAALKKDEMILDFDNVIYDNRDIIFSHCIDVYKELTNGGTNLIDVKDDQLENVISENSADEENFFNEYLEKWDNGLTSVKTINNCIDHYLRERSGIRRPTFKKNVRDYIGRVYKIEAEKYTIAGNVSGYGLKGITLKNGCGVHANIADRQIPVETNEQKLVRLEREIEIVRKEIEKSRK